MSAMSSNAAEVAGDLSVFAVRSAHRARSVVRHHTMLLLTRIKGNANLPAGGPPGPRNITGDYVASWTSEFADTGSEIVGTAGTNRPQGRRLEKGFVGTDRLGRTYNQPPYPHVEPAVADTQPGFEQDMGRIFDGGL